MLRDIFVIAPIKSSIIFSFVLPIAIKVAPFGPRNTGMNVPRARIWSATLASTYGEPKKTFNTVSGNRNITRKRGKVAEKTHFVNII